MTLDTSLFADVADALGISHPAIIEKDYYAVQLLKRLSCLETPGYQLVFSGGTCVAKMLRTMCRMSEDIDIKFIPDDELLHKSRSEQRQLRRELYQQIVNMISAAESFELVVKPVIRNEHKYQQFLIKYPTLWERIEVLRPHIQLELTESSLLESPRLAPISSLYAEVAKQKREIDAFSCVDLEVTAAEKFVALLRRTAAFKRDRKKKDDPALIRHVYDIHLMCEGNIDLEKVASLVSQVIEIDARQFTNQYAEFRERPIDELLFGFHALKEDPSTPQRYTDFIGPLVYHPKPADFETAFSSLEMLVERILKT